MLLYSALSMVDIKSILLLSQRHVFVLRATVTKSPGMTSVRSFCDFNHGWFYETTCPTHILVHDNVKN